MISSAKKINRFPSIESLNYTYINPPYANNPHPKFSILTSPCTLQLQRTAFSELFQTSQWYRNPIANYVTPPNLTLPPTLSTFIFLPNETETFEFPFLFSRRCNGKESPPELKLNLLDKSSRLETTASWFIRKVLPARHSLFKNADNRCV